MIDQSGKNRVDSKRVLEDLVKGTCALVPLGGIGEETGGHKGYGYATAVEILSAALQDGAFLKDLLGYKNGEKVPYRLGHFFIAINIASFIQAERFKKITGDILRNIRSSKKMPGKSRIYTAGEKEYEVWLERRERGVLIGESLQKEIRILMEEFDIKDIIFNPL